MLLATSLVACANLSDQPGDPHLNDWRPGDVIFMNGTSFRSRIVRLLQGYSTDYSHVGIIVLERGEPLVVHADPTAGRVVRQRWNDLISAGDVSGGAVFRMTQSDELALITACARANQFAQEGVRFDYQFDLGTASELFCTELVWRAYSGADSCPNMSAKKSLLLPTDLLKRLQFQRVVCF